VPLGKGIENNGELVLEFDQALRRDFSFEKL
jgi:hypothetical protein